MSAGLFNGVCVIADTDTPQQLAETSGAPKFLVVQAKSDNAASVWIGGENVATGEAVELVAGASIPLPVDDLFDVWVSGTADDEVRYTGGL